MPESKVSQMMATGDVGSMIAAMLLEAGAHARESARRAKDGALRDEEAASAKKLAAMESEADSRFMAGLAEASGSGVVGAAEISTAVFPNTNAKIFTGSGQEGKAISQGASAFFSYDAEASKRESASAEREVAQAKRAIESASDDARDARDLMRRALEHYKELVSAKDEANRAALLRA